MFHYTLYLLSALVAVSSVSGLVIPRKDAPAGWAYGYLEDYHVYHARYLALDCEAQHNTTFFDQCCHPLLATESLEKNRPAQCIPSAAASSSAVAAEPTSTVTTPAQDDDWCDDEEEPESSSAPAPPPSNSPAAQPAPTSEPPKTQSPSSSAKPEATSAPAKVVATSSSKAPEPSSSSEAPAPSSKAPAKTSSAAPPKSTGAPIVDGGSGTFFFQKGQPGACGIVHDDSALIGAIDSARFSQSICGKSAVVTNKANGKSVTITIQDECPTCNNAESMDLSTGAFDAIADESTGLIDIKYQIL